MATNRSPHRISFFWACGLELLVGVLAVVLAWPMGYPLWDQFSWNLADAVIGLAGVIPIALAFVWLLRSSAGWFAQTRQFLEYNLRPFFDRWTIPQFAAVSIAAGVSEEFLFRGVVQSGLGAWLGPWIGFTLASMLFGLVHFVSLQYASIAGVLGVYLGLLLWSTNNLLTPVVTHAAYDFFALVYFLRVHSDRRPPAANCSAP